MSTRISCPQCGTQFQGDSSDALDKLLLQHTADNHDTLAMKHGKVLRDSQAMAVAVANGVRFDRGAARELANRIAGMLSEKLVFVDVPETDAVSEEKAVETEQTPQVADSKRRKINV